MTTHFHDNKTLKSLLIPAVKEALEQIDAHLKNRNKKDRSARLPKHYRYPVLQPAENGLPKFRYTETLKTDHAKIYTDNAPDSRRPFADAFHEYIMNSDPICQYFGIGPYTPESVRKFDEILDNYNSMHSHFFIGHFCDCYIHQSGFGFDQASFDTLYEPFFRILSSPTLEVNIYVPIIYTSFEAGDLELSEQQSIVKIPDSILLTQAKQLDQITPRNRSISIAATHAILLQGWQIPNESAKDLRITLHHPSAYTQVKKTVNTIFAALRVTNPTLDTGYSHFLSVPVGWRSEFSTPIAQAILVDDPYYPQQLENLISCPESNYIPFSKHLEISIVYHQLKRLGNLELAVNRLNKACINRLDDDSIIDIAIALESILTSDSKSEITYRLATRAALLCKLNPFDGHTAEEIFNLCKKIYDFRSSVVHGEPAKQEKKRIITLKENKTVKANEFALEFLKHIIKTVALSPGIKNSADIDKQLFL
ncbi:hypothetical protein ACS5PU_16530 [Pedobacter sp. GSP4]|uniref:hypothetical protein n=1 Tax=Pedobacter sp. GSP4 TaxID=3453716 RepID=UPI003EEA2C9F